MIEYFEYLYSLRTYQLGLLCLIAFLAVLIILKVGSVFDLD